MVIVEVAAWADAEERVGYLGKAAAERHVEVLERDLAEMVGAGPGRHHDGGPRDGVVARLPAQHLEAPGAHGAAGRFRMAAVAPGALGYALQIGTASRGGREWRCWSLRVAAGTCPTKTTL